MAMCCDVASTHATRWIVRALGNRSSVPWLPGADGKPRPTELDMRWVGTLGPWQALRESANWFDPIEAGLRDRAREFLQAMLEAEFDEVLDRPRDMPSWPTPLSTTRKNRDESIRGAG